jgi:hypothetical protein
MPSHHYRTIDGERIYFFRHEFVYEAIKQALVEFQMLQHKENGSFALCTQKEKNEFIQQAHDNADKFIKKGEIK